MKILSRTLIGTVVAGIMVLPAASPAQASDRYDRDHHGRYDYRQGMSGRDAVRQCTSAAMRTANRYSYGGRARVTDIRDVDRKKYGYEVKGRIAVNAMGHAWRHGDRYYGRGWGNDYRGWNRDLRGYDSGKFRCKVDYRGRITGLDFSGIRGL